VRLKRIQSFTYHNKLFLFSYQLNISSLFYCLAYSLSYLIIPVDRCDYFCEFIDSLEIDIFYIKFMYFILFYSILFIN